MHVNTKEIVDWTWETFWWEAGLNSVENYPGGNSGMISKVKNEWRNYNMCTAYAQANLEGDMNVCFNPFLETSSGIPDGLRSNCVSCHGSANIGSNSGPGYPATYDHPVNFAGSEFSGVTRTDFSWAIPGDAQPQSGN